MVEVIEVTGFSVHIELDTPVDVSVANKLFSAEKFNYGSGSLYQKFKAHVSPELAEKLRPYKDWDIYVSDFISSAANFTIVGNKKEEDVVVLAKTLLKLVQETCTNSKATKITLKKRYVAEKNLFENNF